MKGIGIFIAIVLILVLVYLYMLNQKAKEYAQTKPTINNYNGGYELGLNLANLIANTKCGKEGRPPCTKKELEASGWTPAQIAAAEAGATSSGAAGISTLCAAFGIGC